MTTNPTPKDLLTDLIDQARRVKSVEELPPVGTLAKQYAEQVSGKVTPENVEVFLAGTAVVNLLIQEAMLKVIMASAETQAEAPDSENAAYCEGGRDGAALVNQVYDALLNRIVDPIIEGAVIDRTFNDMVAGF